MKICKVDNCNLKHSAKGYCAKHYAQFKRNGRILTRTKYTPNEIIIKPNYAEMVLYNSKMQETGRTLIDLDVVERVSKYKWYLNPNGYVINDSVGFLHRFIMNLDDPKLQVDHIRGRGSELDNRLCNLRICTNAENNRNKALSKSNTSGHKGVSFSKRNNKWEANIKVDYKKIFLGYFDTIEEAVKVRKEAEDKYFKEFNYRGE